MELLWYPKEVTAPASFSLLIQVRVHGFACPYNTRRLIEFMLPWFSFTLVFFLVLTKIDRLH
jgi:hypothetical protein